MNNYNPLKLFELWYDDQLKKSTSIVPSSCCLSTIGLDDYPNARIVSLKKVTDSGFIITGSLNSRKGWEIEKSNKVGLTFWWPKTKRQIRIQGKATKISNPLADEFFSLRNEYSKAISLICKQGMEINDLEEITEKIKNILLKKRNITRPKNWGGYLIIPSRIEFMEYKETRFHDRLLYEIKKNGKWDLIHIQP